MGLGDWFKGIQDLVDDGQDIFDWATDLISGNDDDDIADELEGWLPETLTADEKTSLLNFSKAMMSDFASGSAIIPRYQGGVNKGKIIPPVALAIGPRGPYFLTKHRNAKTDQVQFNKGRSWAENKYNVGSDSSALKR